MSLEMIFLIFARLCDYQILKYSLFRITLHNFILKLGGSQTVAHGPKVAYQAFECGPFKITGFF